ncbi:YbfB/YjiJ family MFS transporter [Quisquiliibacterium transsilvanicum]|uniref:Putative MFS family arabinose efflux permease n=1 Tax=Quisquiliibacterium transsilvanicum TaxID=1549638 RepID=A0A7W8HEG2_9BURK|nr:YbfB/YjiJ family MFS transporter [Quisquiliibacterium transsilvanicum]MBB5270574.1 putative MFS family arabinose efflux permease [Quisquiliibacterium transsilvanicum]
MTRPVALALAGGCALAAGMGIGRFAYTPLLPAMQRELELSLAAAGYVASANFLGYLLGALLAIRVAREHRSFWFLCALAASVATTIAMAPAESPWALGSIRILAGAASAYIMIHGSAIALDALARAGKPMLFSLLAAGVGIGITITALMVEAMSRADASAATMWLALGGLAALLALPATLLRDPPLQHPRPVAAAAPADAAAAAAAAPAAAATPGMAGLPAPNERRALAWLTTAYGLLGFGYVITATFIVVIVRGTPEWRAWEMAVWMCVGLAGAPSNYVWMKIAQRIDPYRAMIAAFLLEAIGVMAAVAGGSLPMVMLGAVLLGGTFMAITAVGLSTGRLLARGESGPTLGRMTAAFGLGQIVGPGLGGWLAERTGSFLAPSMLASATLVACALMVAKARSEARAGTASA